MTADGDLSDAIEAIWDASRPETSRRIATIDVAVRALGRDDLDDRLCARAAADAHKLAGALGIFGLAMGSELARELEQALLDGPGGLASTQPRLTELALALRAEFDTPYTTTIGRSPTRRRHPPTNKVMP